MFIRQNGLTIVVIVISIAARAFLLIVAVLPISSQVLAEIQQKMGNSRLNILPGTFTQSIESLGLAGV
jgi:hypothetical protein